jgi:hypothetical protein
MRSDDECVASDDSSDERNTYDSNTDSDDDDQSLPADGTEFCSRFASLKFDDGKFGGFSGYQLLLELYQADRNFRTSASQLTSRQRKFFYNKLKRYERLFIDLERIRVPFSPLFAATYLKFPNRSYWSPFLVIQAYINSSSNISSSINSDS